MGGVIAVRKNLKLFLALTAGCLLFRHGASARLGWYPDYDELTEKSDAIVIAEDVAVRNLTESAVLQNYQPETRVLGVETTFKVVATLKGQIPKRDFVLHHYRFPTSSAALDMTAVNGTTLVTFLGDKQRYLMFLNLASDGRFTPASGQTDPDLSIRPLSRTNSGNWLVPVFRSLFFWIFLVVILPLVLLVCACVCLKKRKLMHLDCGSSR